MQGCTIEQRTKIEEQQREYANLLAQDDEKIAMVASMSFLTALELLRSSKQKENA